MSEFFRSFSIYNGAALIGLLSIVVPIIIHIINQSRGRIVLIGKIEFVKQAKKLKVTEPKLTQWLLLMIRISFLVLLTLLIAGLYEESKPKTFENNHVYLSQEWLKNANNNDYDKLLKTHVKDDLFLLNEQFEKISSQGMHSISKLMAFREKIKNPISIRQSSLIDELESKNFQPEKTFLYITNLLSGFPDDKSTYTKEYQWRVKKIESELNTNSPISIDIFYDETRITDKSYLASVFEYINENIQRLNVNYHLLPEEILETHNNNQWIFWLTDIEVPEHILERVNAGCYLFTDDKLSNSMKNVTAHLVPLGSELFTFYDRQQVLSHDLKSDIIWGSFSKAIFLTSKKQEQGKIYRFFSRFHHEWTSLVESSSFPSVINKLLVEIEDDTNQMSVSEIKNASVDSSQEKFEKNHLYTWLILLICIFWLLERWLADRTILNSRVSSHE